MASSSLQETKVFLLLTNRQLQGAEGSLQDAAPAHANETDAWLAAGIREAEDDLSKLIEKVRSLIGQI
jgi:hypothetical protein